MLNWTCIVMGNYCSIAPLNGQFLNSCKILEWNFMELGEEEKAWLIPCHKKNCTHTERQNFLFLSTSYSKRQRTTADDITLSQHPVLLLCLELYWRSTPEFCLQARPGDIPFSYSSWKYQQTNSCPSYGIRVYVAFRIISLCRLPVYLFWNQPSQKWLDEKGRVQEEVQRIDEGKNTILRTPWPQIRVFISICHDILSPIPPLHGTANFLSKWME